MAILTSSWKHLKYEGVAQLRSVSTLFFTLLMPVIFFLAMRGLGGDDETMKDFVVPATSIMAIVFGTTMNLAISMVYLREYGMLLRYRLTPLSNLDTVLPKLLVAALISTLSVAVLVVLDWVAFSNPPSFPAILVYLGVIIIMTFAYGTIGVALSLVIPNENSASPIMSVLIIPLLMISGVFMPADFMDLPGWLDAIAGILPFRSSQQLLESIYLADPIVDWPFSAVMILAIWLAVALLSLKFGNLTSPRNRR